MAILLIGGYHFLLLFVGVLVRMKRPVIGQGDNLLAESKGTNLIKRASLAKDDRMVRIEAIGNQSVGT